MKRRAVFIGGVLLSCLFLWLAVRKVSFEALWGHLAGARWGWLLASVVVMLGGYTVLAFRWKLLLHREKPIPYRTVFGVLTIGMFANNVLPARAGELLRAYAMGKQVGLSKSFCLGSIVIERVMDLTSLLLFVFVGGLIVELPKRVQQATVAAGGLFVGVVAFLVVVLAFGAKVDGLFVKLERLVPGRQPGFLVEKFRSFRGGLATVANWRLLPVLLVLSCLIWSLNATSGWLALRSLGVHVPLTAMLFAIGVVNLGIIVPSAPGFVGPYQYFCILALGTLGIERPVALAFSLLFHAAWYIPSTAMGFVAAIRYDLLGSRAIEEAAAEERPEEQGD